MNKHKEDNQHIEYLSYRLTDEQRPYFGLNKIQEEWEEVEIKKGTVVYYQGDVIKKVIHFDQYWKFAYEEFDTELRTNGRNSILPLTAKGKEKKITPTNIRSFKPMGCTIYIRLATAGFESMISAFNSRNNIKLPIDGDECLNTVSELNSWIQDYINSCPDDYFDKVLRMRELPHRTIPYKTGDIFRFEIDREYYGFGIIIGKIKELKKHVSPEHPWNLLMTVPLVIRLYEMKTKDKNIPIDKVVSHNLLRASVMSDNEIIWGTHG